VGGFPPHHAGGCLAITHLPVAQYPTVAPPSISVSANYAGASAETVQNTVTTLIGTADDRH
jgi:multidrug efflux pump subunit AcrB